MVSKLNKPTVILRANGSSLIGFGHLYRLIALAEMLKDNYYIIFTLFNTDTFIIEEIKKVCNEVIILDGELPYKTSDEIKSTDEISFDLDEILKGGEIVVLDGYYFGENYQKRVKEKKCKLVYIDDLAENNFYADVIINHAPGIDHSIYKRQPYTKLFTGLDYSIIRKQFFQPINASERINNDVFICLGGSDYFRITEKLLGFIFDLPQFDNIHIMYSNSYSEEMMTSLQAFANSFGKVYFYKNLEASAIIQLQDKCRYAFISASTVLIEAYSRGLICFTGYYTNNQKFIYNGFIKEKKAIGLGDFRSLTLSNIKTSLFHINSVQYNQKVLESDKTILKLFKTIALNLRKATIDDTELYFVWANDEVVRFNSIKNEPILWENHLKWFNNKLESEKSTLLILEDNKIPVGQVRIDLEGDNFWLIGFSVANEFRGKGHGNSMINLLINNYPSYNFRAFVKENNTASIKVFHNNNFLQKEKILIDNNCYNVFEYKS